MADQQGYRYQAYGLTFAVPFACPALAAAPAGLPADVTVVEGPVPTGLAGPSMIQRAFQAGPEQFLVLPGPRSGRFLVEGGTRVVFAPYPDAQPHKLAARFSDRVIPAILRQRGLLVLHGSAAVLESLTARSRTAGSGAVVIAGASGAGKSTTVAGLLERGALLLSDDVTALRVDEAAGQVHVMPGVGELSLAEMAISRLAIDVAGSPGEPSSRGKLSVPARHRMASCAVALAAIYILSEAEIPGEISGEGHFGIQSAALQVEEQFGSVKFAMVSACLYGPALGGDGPATLALLADVLKQARVFRVIRPAGIWSVEAVCDLIAPADSALQVTP